MADPQLETLRETIITRINEAISSPKPSYKIGDREFDWNGYLKQLWTMVKEIDEKLATGDPYEYHTVVLDPSLDF